MSLRVVVTGATGNVGTSVVRALGDDERVGEIVGVARRMPSWSAPKVRWAAADVASDDLGPLFADADAVIHLAWLIQPSRDGAELERVNVEGSRRVFAAAAAPRGPPPVPPPPGRGHSPRPQDRAGDAARPRERVPPPFYSPPKAAPQH